jgi:cyclic beta-1,2-glucan synthetase
MRGRVNTIDDILTPILNRFQKETFAREEVSERPPFRSELFSTEQMEQHAQHLATTHQLSAKDSPELLLKRLAENETILFEVTNLLHDAVRDKKAITPAGEWLLDNFYLIEDQIKIGKKYLPKGYSKALPRLSNGVSPGFPRVYDIAIQIISHSDGRVDLTSLSKFISAYQKVSHLTIGELWAIPIMLRLALLENLSRVAARIAVDRNDAELAAEWGDKVIQTAEENPKDLVLVIADMARSNPPMVSAFVAEFTRKLQWKGLDLALPLTWIEQHLADGSMTISLMVLAENQKQAADQLSMSNSINSLRFLAKMDWREFVESMSAIEQILREDYRGIYGGMDFYTRDIYRHAVEQIAKNSRKSEVEIAKAALLLARKCASEFPAEKRKSHVGYYLIGPGLKSLEKHAHLKPSFSYALKRFFARYSGKIYTLAALLLTICLGAGLTLKAYEAGLGSKSLIAIAILSVLAASHFALAVTNWLATLLVKPEPLPKMDFSSGIPIEFRTLVAVPTMLESKEQVQRIIDDLEVRFLSNRDSNLFFSLLTDYKDATEETLPDDEELLQLVTRGIEGLNQKYGRLRNDTFFLFHRPRKWNPKEKLWMGYERKRGKLGDLNRLLRGKDESNFSVIVGEPSLFRTVKYVITLDADTQLPRESAQKLSGLMAHPLNHPVVDTKRKIVREGYGIIQPRIAISLHGATLSQYMRMHENDSGIDPYTRVTSDVYQDVFHEGSFIGKGIYDVDAFERTLHNRFPENRILSHDLLEGSYVRCGFASDIQFYEEYPSRYSADIARRHRWVRGDWQIGNWFLPFIPEADRRLHKNPISTLSRWKIFDNLRRSLVPIGMFILLALSFTMLPDGWLWVLTILGIILLPPLFVSGWSATQKPPEVSNTQHFNNAVQLTYRNITQALFSFACLPYEAYVNLHAISITLWRMYISRKKLLEWNPSSQVRVTKEALFDTYVTMWFAPFSVLLLVGYCLLERPQMLVFALPVFVLWTIAPAWVYWLSRPTRASKVKVSQEQRNYLRELARKTWAFFEDLVGPEDNWLPPDNLQQYPIAVVAHRTSPTNIGLSLLANLTAYDFGFITTGRLLERTGYTLDSMEKLERHRGHFYNWYDTTTLRLLNPKYISTVDSGNLAGHLLTLRQGLVSLAQEPIISSRLVDGLHDTLRIVVKADRKKHQDIQDFATWFAAGSVESQSDLKELRKFLKESLERWSHILSSLQSDPITETYRWGLCMQQQVSSVLEEIEYLVPWLDLPAAPEKLQGLEIRISEIPTIAQLTAIDRSIAQQRDTFAGEPFSENENSWITSLENALETAATRARERITQIQKLAEQCFEFADMEYAFLYDKAQHLLSIGFNVEANHRDTSFYDLLASEARLSTFVAIAQGKLPQESWFALGRRLTNADNIPVLLSWSGSMFEYLMPLLVMPTYENTLLDETYKGTVKKQIEYGHQQGVPWGISESCYNIVDTSLTYQYRAFGIPGLGFKRGLGLDLVVAPYATVLALMVDLPASYSNLEKLIAEGYEGKYGFYEAIDYTPTRLPRGHTRVVIQSFMAHHQGMSLLAISSLLLDKPMQKRFETDVQFQTALLLLQEQVPKTTGYYTASTEMEDITPVSSHAQIRVIHTPDTPTPEVQLLSNGRYHVMLTNAGAGYSRWKDSAVTRWREDSTSDPWGSFCYIRDLDTKMFWSNTHQPTLKEPESYTAVFSQGRVEFRRQDEQIESYTEVIVSPEDDIEIRRIHLTNRSKRKRNLELTSYSEVVMAHPMADSLHPAFSNLFVQTEILTGHHAILCTRRARSKEETPPWMFHMMKVRSKGERAISYETDRYKFIGRGRDQVHPLVMYSSKPLSGSEGPVLDPIAAIQYRISIDEGETAIVDLITGVGPTRDESQYLIDRYQDRHMRDRAFELSWTHSQVVLRQINASEEDAEIYGRLASSVIYTNPSLRANAPILIKNQRGQSALWSYSISGDLPIVLLEVSDNANIALVKQMIQAQAYWHLKGLAVDLVILNEDPSGYRQVLQEQIQGLIAAGIGITAGDKQGRIFVRPVDQVSAEDLILLKAVARVIITDTRGTLEDQINRRISTKAAIPYVVPTQSHPPVSGTIAPVENLQFYNGIGGFSEDGREYVINCLNDKPTPLPWTNVIANKNFGTLVTESGICYTWAENAYGYRLTPWNNDSVTDRTGEAYFIRDEITGQYWSAMPNPGRSRIPYVTRHGFGYSQFQHIHDGMHIEVTVFVDLDSPIKFVSFKINNTSGRSRKLSVTGYVEWALADLRSKSASHIVTELNSSTGGIIAKNSYNTDFPNRVAFIDVDDPQYEFTCDRTEFIGRNGTLQHPDAMKRAKLSGKSGAGFDPCTAIRIPFEVNHGTTREVVFRMGAGKDRYEAEDVIRHFRGSKVAARSLEKVKSHWQQKLGMLQIDTPDNALNILTNGWLQYQVISCRVWGRTGFYQSGGAFGFRDQLQDVLALLHADSGMAREQILLAASRQFKEGDVQHWWHPPGGRGVRTLCSDDYVWLPFVTCRYVATTGDKDILNEIVPFIEGRQLNAMEESYYDLPFTSEKKASLYNHCKQSIQHGLRFGKHGLPLIGSGDWNDGMNMVGIHGKGESVWLAFFLYDVLMRFIPIANQCADAEFAEVCKQTALTLRKNIEKNAWDGNWYRRAYFDDGTPLGSSTNTECKIDSISQSWSILSEAGQPERTTKAMKAVETYLINKTKGLLQLLEPPFNTSDMDPGYIKGYVPGVRENGGQYTHAAIWMVMAFAKIGDRARTTELLSMINPINHGSTAEGISVYKVEPYVMAADVYGVHPHTGRGGWTWYTGSAGWMYQLIIDSFIGLKRQGNMLWFEPSIPEGWNSLRVKYTYLNTIYEIEIIQSTSFAEDLTITVDGADQEGKIIVLNDDNQTHLITVKWNSGVKTDTKRLNIKQAGT